MLGIGLVSAGLISIAFAGGTFGKMPPAALGWGLAGFCPGPALASLVSGSGAVGLFVLAMLGGMGLYHLLEPRMRPDSLQT